MNGLFVFTILFTWVALVFGAWFTLQILRQNGRLLLRIEALEELIDETDPSHRFSERSLARSRIRRDGLKAGETAPDFTLPRLNGGGELSLADFRGQRLILVFSSPHCGPCNELAPRLEQFHRSAKGVRILMISRGEPEENRAKAKEHGLTLPIVLQQQWEISRLYAMFATPVAYLIDEKGAIQQDVAVGVEPIVTLLDRAVTRPVPESV